MTCVAVYLVIMDFVKRVKFICQKCDFNSGHASVADIKTNKKFQNNTVNWGYIS